MAGAGTNRQWLFRHPPEGPHDTAAFEWSEGTIPSPADGEALVRNLWLSFDPTQILVLAAPPGAGGVPVGAAVRGLAVSQVLASRHPSFQEGDLVHGYSGWEDYSVIDGHGYFETTKVPAGVPPDLALGALGVTGMAAYFGMTEIGRPTAGETAVVSAAAGGVGSVAVQIARLRGARTIGIAGGPAKKEWLVREARVDGAIDHRSEDVGARLDALCPEGIDVFFDNAGGPILDEALVRLRRNGRIVVCGGTSRYAARPEPSGPRNYLALSLVNGRMEGLLARDYAPRFPEAVASLRAWIASGQLRIKEDVVVGLENAPSALARLFDGSNVGKQLVKIADPPPPVPG